MSCKHMWIVMCATLAALLAVGGPARAGISALPISVKVNDAAQTVMFTIDFPHPPDFFTVDAFHRPADSFQIAIAVNPASGNPFANPTSIVRGDEIQYDKAVVIRNASPPDLADPHSAGWGTIRDKPVPYTLNGDAITFTASFSTLGTADGQFAYRAISLANGVTQDETISESVPLPSALDAMALMGVLGLGAVILRRMASLVRRWDVRVSRLRGDARAFGFLSV